MSLHLFSNPLPSSVSYILCSNSTPLFSTTLSASWMPRAVKKPAIGAIGLKTPVIGREKMGAFIVKASTMPPSDNSETPPEENKEEKAVGIESLPLESKLQQINEQKMKMKLAKKIRLRRKRLVRKRRLRKKGRWPPSKMNKLKNV